MTKRKNAYLTVLSDPHHVFFPGRLIQREHLVHSISEHAHGMNGVDLVDELTGEQFRVYQEDVYRLCNGTMEGKVSWWE